MKMTTKRDCEKFIAKCKNRQKFQRFDVCRHDKFGFCVILGSYSDMCGGYKDSDFKTYQIWIVSDWGKAVHPEGNTLAWINESDLIKA